MEKKRRDDKRREKNSRKENRAEEYRRERKYLVWKTEKIVYLLFIL